MNEANDSKFVTRKWNIVNDNSKSNYNVGNAITYNTEVSKSNLCDYNDAFILVIDDITITASPATLVVFENCKPFTKYITIIDGTTIDDAEDLDLVIPMYDLIEYSSNYSETTGSLWFYSKDKATDFYKNIANTDNFKPLTYKAKLLGNTVAQPANAANGILKNATVAVPLKYLSSFWRSLETPLINCKIELKLKRTKYWVLSVARNENESDNNNNANNIISTIKDTKLYVPVVTLSARYNQKLSKCLSKGSERSLSWNEYKTKSENKNTTNNTSYFLESTCVGVNRFVFVYTNKDGNAKRFNSQKYYVIKRIIKN